MYLERLDIHGFKSFAHRATLEFRRGITAIVGPNGSGKSNVADALRWALGEQSLKLLRGKRAEDVIFAGSDKKTRLGQAEVTLTLNNEDRAADIDYAQVAITRRVNRDGNGEYFVNRTPGRLQDIQLLLAKANFGQRSYAVIGQGMVDSFLIASPQERKELFEDATGVRQYQLKRDQAMTKLDHTQENLRQAEVVMQEIEPRLRSLTRQVKRLERREEVERELRGLQRTLYAKRLRLLDRARDEQGDVLAKAEAIRTKLRDALTGIQRELDRIEREQTSSEVFQRLQTNYTKLLNEKNTLVEELSELRGQVHAKAIAAGDADRVFLEKRLSELDRRLEETAAERSLAEEATKREAGIVETKQREVDALSGEFAKLERSLATAREAIEHEGALKPEELHSALLTLIADAEIILEELERIEQQPVDLAKLKRESQRIRKTIAGLKQRLERATLSDTKELLALQTALTEFTGQRERLARELAEAQTRSRVADEQLRNQEERFTTLTTERADVERTLESLRRRSASPEDAEAEVRRRRTEVEATTAKLDRDLAAVRTELSNFHTKEQEKKDRLFVLQKSFQEEQHKLTAEDQRASGIQVELAKLDTRREDLLHEMGLELPEDVRLATVTDAEGAGPASEPSDAEQEEVIRLKHQVDLIGGIEEGTTAEYAQTKERFDYLSAQVEDLTKARADLEQVITELDETIKTRFDESFERINEQFSRFFRTLFNGGRAKLTLLKQDVVEQAETDDEDDEEEDDDEEDKNERQPSAPTTPAKVKRVIAGIDIQATPPGKKLTSIAMLSGGERALTSIALICAIIANNPAPFVVLDEVDAALDEANSVRFAAILEKLAETTQFITITHNRATMEKANILYGVTMGDDGVSKLLSVKMEDVDEVIAAHGNR